jgi:hypothetical protein
MKTDKDYFSWLSAYGKESVLPDKGIIIAEGLNHILTIYPNGELVETAKKQQDLKSLSEFWRVVKNYIKMKVIQKRK